MGMLVKSRATGFFNSTAAHDNRKKNADLDAFRSREEFKKWLNDLEKE
jgi:hypothetical protein